MGPYEREQRLELPMEEGIHRRDELGQHPGERDVNAMVAQLEPAVERVPGRQRRTREGRARRDLPQHLPGLLGAVVDGNGEQAVLEFRVQHGQGGGDERADGALPHDPARLAALGHEADEPALREQGAQVVVGSAVGDAGRFREHDDPMGQGLGVVGQRRRAETGQKVDRTRRKELERAGYDDGLPRARTTAEDHGQRGLEEAADHDEERQRCGRVRANHAVPVQGNEKPVEDRGMLEQVAALRKRLRPSRRTRYGVRGGLVVPRVLAQR